MVYASTEAKGEENEEVREEDSNESREERLTHSLPNGGFRILVMDRDSPLPGSVSPGVSHSPRALLSQLSDPSSGESPTPPPPPPPLSPVSEGEILPSEEEGDGEEEDGEEGDGEEEREQEDVGGEEEEEEGGGHILMSPLSADLPVIFLGTPSEHPGGQKEEGEKGEREEDVMVAAKGSPVVPLSGVASPTPDSVISTASPRDTAGLHDDHTPHTPTSADSPSAPVTLRQKQQQTIHRTRSDSYPPTKDLSVSDISMRFNPKRASVASIATEWYSADEDEEGDSNLSDSPELRETLILLSSGTNLLDDELGLFSTPPSSPPLGPHSLERGSPLPHSPSPLEICQRGAGDQERGGNLEEEGPLISSADYNSQQLPQSDLLRTRGNVDVEGEGGVDGKGVGGESVRGVDGENVRDVGGEGGGGGWRDSVDGEVTSTGTLKRRHLSTQGGHSEREGGGGGREGVGGGRRERVLCSRQSTLWRTVCVPSGQRTSVTLWREVSKPSQQGRLAETQGAQTKRAAL